MIGRTALYTFLVLVGLFSFCTQAEATWYWTHGNSAHVEDESAVVSVIHKGIGLEVDPQFDSSTWVHFAVPTIGDKTQGARYIRVRFKIENALNSRISRVRVYNGNKIVKTFNVNWFSAGVQTKSLDLGSIVSFGLGMGVSMEFESGPESGIDRYIFIGVGANFVAIP